MAELGDRVTALAERRRNRRAAEQVERDAKRESMREAMPSVAKAVDAMRAVFGEDCRVLTAEENGQRVSVSKAKLRALGLSDE